jgi:AcrR family transcriptional regulator
MGAVSTTRSESVRGRPRSVLADSAIVEAALALLMEQTYSGFTMAAVAARAGVSTATLYRRYQNKDDLILDALLRRVEERRHYPDTGSLAGDLRELLTLIVESLLQDGGRITRALIGETMRNQPLADRLREQLETPHQSQLRLILERAVDRGEIPEPPDLTVSANLVVGPLYHRFLMTGEVLSDGVVDELVPLLLRALGHVQPPS